MTLSLAEVVRRLDDENPNGTGPGASAAIERLLREDLTDDARLMVNLLRAQQLGGAEDWPAAAHLLERIEPELRERAPRRAAADQTLLEALHSAALALLLLALGDSRAAAEECNRSRARFLTLGLQWRAATLLINQAIAAGASGDRQAAWDLLERAEQESERADVPPAWRAARRGVIGINRAGLRHMAQDVDGAIREYVDARPQVLEARDLQSLGILDFNLAGLYMQSKRYGSALEAAHAAATGCGRAGNRATRNRALAVAGAALEKMGRYHEAEQVLSGILAEAPAHPGAVERLWMAEAMNPLASVYRNTGRYRESDELEPTRVALDAVPVDEVRALEQAMLRIFEAVDALTQGRRPPPWPERRQALDALRNSTLHPRADRVAQLFDALCDALYEGRTPPPLSNDDRELLLAINLPPAEYESLIEIALGLRLRDDERTLHAYLGDLVRYQEEVSTQEGSAYRSSMLASRGGLDLDVVIPLLIKQEKATVLFEVIEFCRRDFRAAELPLPRNLLPYRQLVNGDDDVPTALARPAGLTVGGESELRRAVPELHIAGDAHRLRERLAGPGSAWWTMMIHRGAVVWALLTPDGASCGRMPWSEVANRCFRQHLRALPIPLDDDVDAIDLHERRWCAPTVAIARAALGPLLDDAELASRCLRALPDDVAARCVAQRRDDDEGSLADVYGPLGELLIPPAVNAHLDCWGEDASLLVSVQPELATIPTCLLRSGDGRPLLERATLTYAPPARVAARAAEAPGGCGAATATLAVLNPTGDLSSVFDPDAACLVGWGEAAHPDAVATEARVVAGLRGVAREPGPTAFAFVGHIEAGSPEAPSAALVVAPDRDAADPAFLAASALAAPDWSMPDRVYLGGCEGAGFGTSLEWSSVAAAALSNGTACVLAHRWPIVDAPGAASVDAACTALVRSTGDIAAALRQRQRNWLRDWAAHRSSSLAPHHWAGLQAIGRATAEEGA